MRILLLVVLLTLNGCAALKTAGFLTSLGGAASNGINADAELTVGKKEEAVNTDVQVGDNTSIQGQEVTMNTQGMKWWQFLAFGLACGWAIPDPQTMGRGLILFIRALLPFGGNK